MEWRLFGTGSVLCVIAAVGLAAERIDGGPVGRVAETAVAGMSTTTTTAGPSRDPGWATERPGRTSTTSVPTVPSSPVPGAATAVTGVLRPSYPPGFARLLAARLAGADPATACDLFAAAAADRFAAIHGAGDCPTAAGHLRARITDPVRYASPDLSARGPDRTGDGRPVVDVCGLTWTGFGGGPTPPGPARLGRLVLAHPPGDHVGWWVAAVARC